MVFYYERKTSAQIWKRLDTKCLLKIDVLFREYLIHTKKHIKNFDQKDYVVWFLLD